MIDISKNEKDAIAKYAAHILSLCDEGMDVKAVLSRAYCELMCDKSPRQTELLAEEICWQISEFRLWYEICVNEPESCEYIYLNDLIKDLSLREQCETLYMMAEGAALYGLNVAESSKYTGEVSESARDRLMSIAAKAIVNMPEAQSTENLLPDLNAEISSELFEALCSLIIYCMAKKGEIEDCPRNVSLEQIVSCVCRDASLREIRTALESQYIGELEAKRRRDAAQKVLKMLLLCSCCYGGVLALFSNSLPAAIAVAKAAVKASGKLSAAVSDMVTRMMGAIGLSLPRQRVSRRREIEIDVQLPREQSEIFAEAKSFETKLEALTEEELNI